MKWVADENVDSSIVEALRKSGHEVWYVAEEAVGIEDDEVLQRAANDNALLITSDKDFGDLVFRQGRTSAGVLLLRLAGAPPSEKAQVVANAVRNFQDDLISAFSVLTRTALRIRRRESGD